MTQKTHLVDAEGKILGRLASRIAFLLQDKHKPDFSPNKAGEDIVLVKNVKKLKFDSKKLEGKLYFRHSGYLGGTREIPLKKIFEKEPSKVLKMAVSGMLPKNKLRKERIKRLKVET